MLLNINNEEVINKVEKEVLKLMKDVKWKGVIFFDYKNKIYIWW